MYMSNLKMFVYHYYDNNMHLFVILFNYRMNVYVILIYLAAIFNLEVLSLASVELVEYPKMCIMERAYKKLGYVCSHMDLKEVPQFLKTSLQVCTFFCFFFNLLL